MIELFTIFGKGGLVLWCFDKGSSYFKDTINDLISTVLLQERSNSLFTQDNISLKYKLDNEFDIIILIVYQSIVQLAYADKLLTETHIRFRDLYKNVLRNGDFFLNGSKTFDSFTIEFKRIFNNVQRAVKDEPHKPKTFQESDKSKKTIASMMETAADRVAVKAKSAKEAAILAKQKGKQINDIQEKPFSKISSSSEATPHNSPRPQKILEVDEEILRNRNAFFQKKKKGKALKVNKDCTVESSENKKKEKKARVWEFGGTIKDMAVLDYSAEEPKACDVNRENGKSIEIDVHNFYEQNVKFVGTFKGELPDLNENDNKKNNDIDFIENNENFEKIEKKSIGGWFSSFKSLIGNKQLTEEDIEPVLEQIKEILITKNVATEPTLKICKSVGSKLQGKMIGSFDRVYSIVKEAMHVSLVQLLTPKRRVDILRDVMEAKEKNQPYVIVFCGVNGVGKSTNLAKITFWLNENNYRVLIAAGDTFRAGAVEQLRTHTRHLNALHPQGVQLYEQGYGKDPASLASAAIKIAKEHQIDVVLVDTAGRMQDNEPLMRSLSKLISLNKPDLVLFVGEALVGNEAVDQLLKFNQALSDNSATESKPRLIDGIVLTKFDTIDDKVGAAVSMTYITGQPIVFVGTGQTYKDLKNLNVDAVVNSLLK